MPLIRPEETEENIKKEEELKKEKKDIKKKTINSKLYPVLYIIIAIVVFGLGLLVIALINLAIGNGFKI